MEYRELGRTGVSVPEIGFGCGNVGGLMIRAPHDEQVAAVRHALAEGIDYFDTATAYGDGESEMHLGEVLAEIGAEVHVATKVRLSLDDRADIPAAVRRSVEGSLRRLRREHIDIIQLHNNVTLERDGVGSTIALADVLGPGGVADAFDAVKGEGLARHIGFTGMGETPALHQIVDSGRFETMQSYYNMLNPSAGNAVPASYPNQDYDGLIARASARGMGVIVIRVLAGGTLGGSDRHTLASAKLGAPMATGNDYDSDLRRAGALGFLARDGWSLPQAGIRFALDNRQVSTVLVGFSDQAQMDEALAAQRAPSADAATRERVERLWATDFS